MLGDMAGHPLLDPAPLACARREMAYRNDQPSLVRQLLKAAFPGLGAVAIVAATIRGHQKARGIRIHRLPHLLPPDANGLDRELGRGVIFLSGVRRDHWLLILLEADGLRVDVGKLPFPVRVDPALVRVSVGLKAEALCLEHPSHRFPGDLVAQLTQGRGQVLSALRGPEQGDIGSPWGAGSTSNSRSRTRAGSPSDKLFRPAPSDRTRPALEGSAYSPAGIPCAALSAE